LIEENFLEPDVGFMATQGDLETVPLPFREVIEELHSRYKSLKEGAVAKYIPELAKVNPDLFRW
jgi:glutaminase